MRTAAKPLASAVGGAANESGSALRAGFSAVIAAHVLRGWHISALDLERDDAVPESLELETDAPVDDIGMNLGGGGRAYLQVKSRLTLSLRAKSAFSEALDQCVELARTVELDPERDRLVLACRHASQPVLDLDSGLRRRRSEFPGAPSAAENRSLSKIQPGLTPLSESQCDRLLACLVIWVGNPVDPTGDLSERAALMLDSTVVAAGEGPAARAALVNASREFARQRSGASAEGLLRVLREARLRVMEDVSGVDGAKLAFRLRVSADHRRRLQGEGETLRLVGIGSELPALKLRDVDAEVTVTEPGIDEEREHGRELPLVLRRRGRLLLTGLPGSGKSTALTAAAAAHASESTTPLPLVARLDRVAQRMDQRGFIDGLLDVACEKALPDDRATLRQEFVDALRRGTCTMFLDSLDETRERAVDVVEGLQSMLNEVHRDVEVLLATRDSASQHARVLQFREGRLLPPSNVDRTVRAIVQAVGKHSEVENLDPWVDARVKWVDRALVGDSALRETPLMPVLLAFTASAHESETALPTNRAEILRSVIADVVRKWESRRSRRKDLELGALRGERAAEALLESFREQASYLADHSLPQQSFVKEEIAESLGSDWKLSTPDARATASEAMRFWDEVGIFLIENDGRVTPRVMLFVELGKALHVASLSSERQREWTLEAAKSTSSLETLKLASCLSLVVADQFCLSAASQGDSEMLFAACAALRQGASVGDASVTNLVGGLVTTLGAGGPTMAKASRELAALPVPVDLRPTVRAAINAALPADHAVVVNSLYDLSWPGEHANSDTLRHILHSAQPERLEPHEPTDIRGKIVLWMNTSDLGWSDVIASATEILAPEHERDARRAVKLVESVGRNQSERMETALRNAGYGDALDREHQATWSKIRGSFDWSAQLERSNETDRCLLGKIAEFAPQADLTPGQRRNLDELIDVVFTLGIPRASAFEPAKVILDRPEILGTMVEAAIVLGRFDASVLSAQAKQLASEWGENGEFRNASLLYIPGDSRELTGWSEVDDPTDLATRLMAVLLDEWFASHFAIQALVSAPASVGVADLALSTLTQATLWHRFNVALVILLASDRSADRLIAAEWQDVSDAQLRRAVAFWASRSFAERSELRALVVGALTDPDEYVRETALKGLNGVVVDPEMTELIVDAGSGGSTWECSYCGKVEPAGSSSCKKCKRVGPDISKAVKALVASEPKDASQAETGAW